MCHFFFFLWRTNSDLYFFLFLFKAHEADGGLQVFVIFPVSPFLPWLVGRFFFFPFICFSVSAAMRPVLPEEV